MSTSQPADVTQAISRFEAAWARGESPQLDSFIPPDQADNVELVAELVAVDLERRLKADESIRVESYLEQFPQIADAPERVVDLLVAEFDYRCRLNPALAVDEYLDRFPQYRDELLARLVAFDETLVDSDRLATRAITPTATEEVDETVDGLLRRMVEVGLVTDQTVSNSRKSLPTDERDNQQQIVDRLLREERVTAWQLKQLRAGQKTFLLENGRYLLLDELGKGGMGAVYRARHVGLNRDVALKTIDPRQAKNKQLIGRFQREIAVCAKLQHEHIVQAYDMGCHQGVHFLVLEYVQGADLASLIKRDGPMWPDEVAAVGLQIAAALAYAHAEGVVHRDIKPHNILLSSDGISKLLDMGLASNHADDGAAEAITSLTQTGMVLGTADYMPPEQAADLAKVDGRSDIYSLGATLYYLLTGQPPFPGGDMMNKMHRLANEEPAAIGQLRPDCPRELTDVIERMLAKRPESRYQSAVEVVQTLQPLAAERIAGRHVMTRAVHTAAEADTGTPHAATVAVTPFALASDDTVATSMLRRKSKPIPKKWWIGGAAALLLLMLSFGLIAWSLNSGDPDGDSAANPVSVPVVAATQPLGVREEIQGHYFTSGASYSMVGALSPDGTRLATGAADGRVFVWDILKRTPILCYRGHDSLIVGVCWSSDGNLIASRDYRNGTIDVWNSSSGERRARTETSSLKLQWHAMAFAPGKNELAYATHKVINSSVKQDVRRWDFGTDKHSFVGIQQAVASTTVIYGNFRLRYSPDGEYLASWQFRTPLNIYHLESGEKIIQYDDQRESVHRDVGFLPDGRIAVVNEREARFFNVAGVPIESKLFPPELLPRAKTDFTQGVAIGENGRRLLIWINRHKPRLFDLVSWNIVATARSENPLQSRLAWEATPDLTRVAVMQDSYGVIIETADPSQRTIMRYTLPLKFGGPGAPLPEPVVLGNGRYLRASNTPGCWDLHKGSELFQFPTIGHVHPDGTIDAVIASINSGSARVLRYADGEAVRKGRFDVVSELKEPQEYVRTLQWSGDGRFVYGISSDRNTVRFWNVATGDIAREVVLSKATDSAVHLSRNGDTLVAQRHNVVIRSFDVFDRTGTSRTIKLPANMSLAHFNNAVLSPEGDRFIAHVDAKEIHAVLWDTHSETLLHEFNIDDLQQHQFLRFRFADSGRFCALSDVVFDAETGERLWRCPERTRARTSLSGCFFPNEDYIVLPVDNQYQIWNWKSNEKVFSLYVLPDENWAMVDSQFNVSGTRIAPQYLRFLHKDKAGKQAWLKQSQFEKQTGWQNDPDKVRFIMPPAEPHE